MMASPTKQEKIVAETTATKNDQSQQQKAKEVDNDERAAKDEGEPLQESVTNASVFVPPPMSALQRRLTILSLCLTLFLSALDITIISTALPTIATELGVTAQQYAWMSSGFMLASTASTPVWAKASDIFGRKSITMICAGVFMAGSLVCALARNSNTLIGGRVLQGLGAGGSVVMATIVIGDLFVLEDRAKYYGMTGIVWGISSAVGPVLGGVFAQTIGWRWCFYINLPFDGLALIVLFFALKVKTKREPVLESLKKLDWTGFVLIIGGAICFLYGLELGASGMGSWSSAPVISLMVVGIALLAAFVFWEAKVASYPIIPGRIFNKTTNVASFTISCLHSFVFISFDFYLPLYSQVMLGFSPLISGITLFALIIPLSTMPMAGAFIIRRTSNYKYILFVGAGLMTLGGGLFISFTTKREWAKIILYQVITGIGAGLLFQSPMIALQSFLHQKDMAAAMSAYSFLRNLSTSVSVVIGAVLIQHSVKGGSLTSVHADTEENGDTEHRASPGEYMSGLRTMWTFYTAVSGLMLVVACFVKQKRPSIKNEEVAADKTKKEKSESSEVI